MILEQREVLDETINKIRLGRITRRTFLERAAVIGLSSSAAVSLLEACGGTSNSAGGNGKTTMIAWESVHDATGGYQKIVDEFNKQNNGVHVVFTNGTPDTGQLLTLFTTMLRARSHTYDVMSMDIIWPPEFGSNGWSVPLDNLLPSGERQKFFQGPIQGCTYNGKLWAVPLTTEPHMLYYRTDLVPTPPQTWDELASMAKSLSPSKTQFGYIWDGFQYEGLTCDFIDILYGYGGAVLDPNDPKKVVVNSPEAQQALTQMVSWVGTISPKSVTSYQIEDARAVWQNGNAAFMSNWVYAFALGNDPKSSKIAHKYNMRSLLAGGNGTTGHSCIGGWQLGINAFSQNTDAAWKFMQYMTSEPVQKQVVINTSQFSPIASVSNDAEVVAKAPYTVQVKAALENGKSRPGSPIYPDITRAIQLRIHQAISGTSSPASALASLQSDLEAVLAK